MVCPLYRGCPLLRGSNRIILIGRDKFGDLVLSIVDRYLIQCPFLGGSSLRGSTVYHNMCNVCIELFIYILLLKFLLFLEMPINDRYLPLEQALSLELES